MAFSLEPFDARHIEPARRFNVRLREQNGDTNFLLPEHAPELAASTEFTPFLRRHWILMQEGEARGGALLQDLDCVAGPAVQRVTNIQTPVTEGAFRPGASHLGPILIKLIAARCPLLYAVGMGSLQEPFPKMLQALRWRVRLTGFFFHVGRGSRMFRELAPLRQTGWMRLAGSIAAASALGGPAIRMAHALTAWKFGPVRAPAMLQSTQIEHWDTWASGIWAAARAHISCGAVRDAQTLPHLYPTGEPVRIFRLDGPDGSPAGWMALLCTQMNGGHFGRLCVGTIVDALTVPGKEQYAIHAATSTLWDMGAELLIANHTHTAWIAALRANGYFAGPSNYVFAASPALVKAWEAQDPAGNEIFVNRGDGDGRIHL